MRNAREKILQDTAGMSWEEERAYLRTRGSFFLKFVRQVPNDGATSIGPLAASAKAPAASGARGLPDVRRTEP